MGTETNDAANTTTTDDVKTGTVDTTAKASAKDGANPEGGKPKPDDKEDVSGLKKALQATRKERDDLLKAQRDAELAKLPELERAKSLVDELTKENEKLKTDNMRRQVAMELGLPWKIGKRLEGDTEDDMRADGADLLKEYKADNPQVVKDDKVNKRPTNDAKKSGAASGHSMNDLLRAAAGRRAI